MKKSVNTTIITFLGGIFSIILSCFPTKAQERPLSPTPGEFPIVASTVFSNLTGPQPGDLKDIKECGFNLCMHSSTPERFEKLLGYMEGTGLKLLLHTTDFLVHKSDKTGKWKRDIPNFINKFKNNPLVAGWEFSDEPQWNDLSGLKNRYELLIKNDPDKFILINLVGQIAKPFTGTCKTLPAYLDSINKVFDMDVWSSDYYPILIRNKELVIQYEGFFYDLQSFSDMAKKTGRPMWAYCESMEYKAKGYSRPAATLPYLSFEAFSALAYGAQGLVYWTYWQRPSNQAEEYVSALVDLNGNRTKAWYAAQKVNSQIRALTPVFLGAEMVKCVHSGNIRMSGKVTQITNFGPFKRIIDKEKGVLASHLRNGHTNYTIIVNHDIQKKQKIVCELNSSKAVSKITVDNNGALSRNPVTSKVTVNLEPGGYAIFEW